MLTGVPCSRASRSTRFGSSVSTSWVGPRLRPSAQPTTGYPRLRSQVRSVLVDRSEAMRPGRTRTGCGSPRGANHRSGKPAARAPALTSVRAGSVSARNRRCPDRDSEPELMSPSVVVVRTPSEELSPWTRRGTPWGPASTANLTRTAMVLSEAARSGCSVGGGREHPRHEDLVDRPGTDVLAAGAGHPGVPRPAPALVVGVPAQLGVADRGLPVVLTEGVAAAAHRRRGRGRGGAAPVQPAPDEADRQQRATHQQTDRFHARAPFPLRSPRR